MGYCVILLPQLNNGWLPEWPKGAALKTVVSKGTGGSNPSPSATRREPSLMGLESVSQVNMPF